MWFHPDQSDRLAILARARAALDAAEAALDAVGYVDNVLLPPQDYRTAAQRERNAFELGREYGGSVGEARSSRQVRMVTESVTQLSPGDF